MCEENEGEKQRRETVSFICSLVANSAVETTDLIEFHSPSQLSGIPLWTFSACERVLNGFLNGIGKCSRFFLLSSSSLSASSSSSFISLACSFTTRCRYVRDTFECPVPSGSFGNPAGRGKKRCTEELVRCITISSASARERCWRGVPAGKERGSTPSGTEGEEEEDDEEEEDEEGGREEEGGGV